MDIQKMINDRIDELRSQRIHFSPPVPREEEIHVEPERFLREHRSHEDDGLRHREDDGPAQIEKVPPRRFMDEPMRRAAEEPAWRDHPRPLPPRKSRSESLETANHVDESLVEVAERIISITDRIAGDYARMEKDILDSRLVVLQSAETVLDIAISLREKAKTITSSLADDSVEDHGYTGVRRILDAGRDLVDESHSHEGRASMHDQGVASLFRKT